MIRENGKKRVIDKGLDKALRDHYYEAQSADLPIFGKTFRRNRYRLACPLFLTLLCFGSPLSGGTYVVTNPNETKVSAGKTAEPGTLRHAILQANLDPNPSTIYIQTFQPILLKSSLPPISASGLSIIGMGDTPTIIDGQKRYAGLTIASTNNQASINYHHLTIQNTVGGESSTEALHVSPGTTLTQTSVSFINNQANHGAIFLDGPLTGDNSRATLNLIDGHFSGNSQDIFMKDGSRLNVVFVEKKALSLGIDGDVMDDLHANAKGGGISVSGPGSLTLREQLSHFSGNSSISDGATLVVSSDGSLGVPLNSLELDKGTFQAATSLSTKRAISFTDDSTLSAIGEKTVLSLEGLISSQSGGRLNLSGDGAIHLANPSNSFKEEVWIAPNATAIISNDGGFGDVTNPIVFSGLYEQPSNLKLSSTNVAIDRPLHLVGDGKIIVESAGEIKGPISGKGKLHLSGTTPLKITANKETSYSGKTNITAASLELTGINPLGSSPLHFHSSGGSLKLSDATLSNEIRVLSTLYLVPTSESNSLIGSLNGSGPIHYQGSDNKTITLKPTFGSDNYAGVISLESGLLKTGRDSPLGGSAATVQLNGGHLEFVLNGIYPNTFDFHADTTVTSTAENTVLNGLLKGEGAWTLKGPSSLTILGSNTISGKLTLDSTLGTLKLAGANPLGRAEVQVYSGDIEFIKLDSKKVAHQLLSNSFSFNNPTTITSHPGTVSTLSGDLKGASPLHLKGEGTIVIHGNGNSFPGGTHLHEGVLQLGGKNPLGVGDFHFEGGRVELVQNTSLGNKFDLSFLDAKVVNHGTTSSLNILAGDKSLILQGLGELSLKDASAFSGPISLEGGQLTLTHTSGYGTGLLTFDGGALALGANDIELPSHISLGSSGGIFILKDGTSNTFRGTLMGDTSFTVDQESSTKGTGVLKLRSSNLTSGNGGLTLKGGIVDIQSESELPEGVLTFNGGTLQLSQNISLDNNITLESRGGTIAPLDHVSVLFSNPLSGPGGITIAGSGKVQLHGHNDYVGATILKSGTLQVSGQNPLGKGPLYFDGGFFETLEQTSFNNQVHLNSSGMFASSTQTKTVLSGPVVGKGALTLIGPGTLTLTGNNTYKGGTSLMEGLLQIRGLSPLGTGSVIIGCGTLQMVGNSTVNNEIQALGNVTFTADGGSESIFHAGISGAGDLVKNGAGKITFKAPSIYTGRTSIAEGSLFIESSLGSPTIAVEKGATFGGTGKVNKLDVSGTLSPIGHQGGLVAKSLQFRAGSNFQPLLGGSSPSLVYSSENVTIEKGVTLDPVLPPYIARNYTLLETDPLSKIEGTFLFYNYGSLRHPISVDYFQSSVVLSVQTTPFAVLLPKGNLQNIGFCFDNVSLGGGSDLITVTSILDGLTPRELAGAFSQFDPSIYNVLSFSEEAVAERTRALFTDHADSRRFVPDVVWGVWATTFAERIKQEKLGNSLSKGGYNDRFGGIVIGLDTFPLTEFLVSTGFSYAHSKVDWREIEAKATLDSYTAFIGTAWFDEYWSADAYGSYTYHSAGGDRDILILPSQINPPPINSPLYTTPIARTLEEKSKANSLMGHLGATTRVALEEIPLYFLGFANLDYINVHQNGFSEHGGGILDLSIESKNGDLLRPEIGFGAGFTGSLRTLERVFAEIRISYVKEIRFSGKGTKASFSGNPCSFQVEGLFPEQNLISTSFSLGISSYKGFDLSLNYTGVFGGDYTENAGKIELVYLF